MKPLGNREFQILGLMAEGLSNKEIGAQLYLSDNTIKEYASRIIRKLEAKNRTNAVWIACRLGLLVLDHRWNWTPKPELAAS